METLFFASPYTPADVVNAFFLYSFLGWCMECVVIRREKGAWENRGFVHLPFCIIYGCGSMLGYVVLKPFSYNYIVLYLAGAVVATVFEFLTAKLMLKLFGTLWWDYTNKPFNYKGILCLESTLGWGVIAVLLFAVMHRVALFAVTRVRGVASWTIAALLVCAYALDFILSMRAALEAHAQRQESGKDAIAHDSQGETERLPY